MLIRALRAGEGAALREFRLRALRDAPQAYFWSVAAEERVSAADWERWTEDPANDRVMFLAMARPDGDWLGMAGCRLRGDGGPDTGDTLDATGMWVAPAARGQRIGERLIEAIVEWGRARGAASMEFAVTETNDVAIALYRRLGFEPTGRRRPLESNPQLVGMFMAKRL